MKFEEKIMKEFEERILKMWDEFLASRRKPKWLPVWMHKKILSYKIEKLVKKYIMSKDI